MISKRSTPPNRRRRKKSSDAARISHVHGRRAATDRTDFDRLWPEYDADAALIPEIANYGKGGVAMIGLLLGTANAGMIFEGVAKGAPPASTAYPVGSIMHNSAALNIGDPTMWKLVNRGGVLTWCVAGTLQS